MKNSIKACAVLSLAFLISSQAYAGSSAVENKVKSMLNDISITNSTNKDVAYRVVSSSGSDNLYGIKHGKTDVYHAKTNGDKKVTFEMGECKRINSITGLCLEVDANSMKNSVSNKHYHAYLIKTIKISSINACTVTCLDGTATSCIVE